MTAVEILKAGRELLSDPARCTKGAYARNADGVPIGPASPEAAQWCSLGAINKYSDCSPSVAIRTEELLGLGFKAVLITAVGITVDHDRSDHPTILRAWDRAIELAEAQVKEIKMKRILLFLTLLLAGCTHSEPDARRILIADGIDASTLQLSGYAFFGCSDQDSFHTGFSGKKNGKPVTGVLCGGWMKANTIRYF